MTRRAALATVILVLAPAISLAQVLSAQNGALREGTRVRVTTTDGLRFSGRILAADRDSIVVARDSSEAIVSLPPSAVRQLEVSLGISDQMRRSAGIGMLVGGVIGGLVGHLSYQKPERSCKQGEFLCIDLSGLDQMMSEMSGALIGFGVGGVIGAVVGSRPQEDWNVVTVHGTALRLDVAPKLAGGVGFSAHMAF